MHSVLFRSLIVARLVSTVMNNYRMPLFQYGEIYSFTETGSGTSGCREERWCEWERWDEAVLPLLKGTPLFQSSLNAYFSPGRSSLTTCGSEVLIASITWLATLWFFTHTCTPVDPWTRWGLGRRPLSPPHNWKSACNFWLLQKRELPIAYCWPRPYR